MLLSRKRKHTICHPKEKERHNVMRLFFNLKSIQKVCFAASYTVSLHFLEPDKAQSYWIPGRPPPTRGRPSWDNHRFCGDSKTTPFRRLVTLITQNTQEVSLGVASLQISQTLNQKSIGLPWKTRSHLSLGFAPLLFFCFFLLKTAGPRDRVKFTAVLWGGVSLEGVRQRRHGSRHVQHQTDDEQTNLHRGKGTRNHHGDKY